MKRTARRLRRKVLSVLMSVALIMAMMPAEFVLADDPVCKIGETTYETLADAVAAAGSGDTITLVNNVDEDASILMTKDLTIDMNGFDITINNDPAIKFTTANVDLVITGEGTITSTDSNGDAIGIRAADCSLVVDEDVTLVGVYGISMYTAAPRANVDMKGTINATHSGMYINGNLVNEADAPTVNVSGTIVSAETGIYAAGYGKWTISGDITAGTTGIEIRAGELNVKDGASIESTATTFSEAPDGNGTSVMGAGIAVSQHTTKKPIAVNIEGGTISGPVALYQNDVQGNGAAATELITMDVSGGSFEGTLEDNAVDVTNVTNFISGGSFNEEVPATYLAEGCAATENSGTYEIIVENVAKIGDTLYPTILDAVDAAQSGATIKLINNTAVTTPIMISKDLVIDGNGHEIDCKATRGIRIDTNGVDLELYNLSMKTSNNKCERVVQIDSNITGATIKIDGCDLGFVKYYAVNLCSNTSYTVDITNSRIEGWAAINAYGEGIINVSDSELVGTCIWGYNPTNNFAVVVVNNDGITVNLEDTIVTGDSNESGNIMGGLIVPADSKVNVEGDCEFTYDGPYLGINTPTDSVDIYNGTFSSDPSEYTVKGYTGAPNNDGTFGVVAGVAKIDNDVYDSLAEAVEAAQAGDTIIMVGDEELDASQTIDKEVTIDLNGCTISGGDGVTRVIDIAATGDLTIEDSDGAGKITIPQTNIATRSETIGNNGTLTVNGGTIENNDTWAGGGSYAIRCENGTTPGNSVTINGGEILCPGGYGATVFQGDSFTMTDGNIEAAYGIANSGNPGDPTTMTISGGTITSPADTAIYHPGAGTLTITGGTITGATGIEIRAGELNVSGGTITGTAQPTSVTPNGNGSTTLGAGIAIAQHTTKNNITVNISGGQISGYSAVYESNPQNNTQEETDRISIDITDGTFEAINGGTVTVYSQDKENFIRGGSYDSIVDEDLCAEGYSPVTEKNAQGMYTVEVNEGLMEVDPYKGNKEQENWTYPTESGKIFAGWYTDETCTTPYTGTTGAAYPKFVDEKVLKARAQLRLAEGDEEGDSLRFITNVDKMDYLEAGFIISNNGVESAKRAKVTKVFRSLIGNGVTQLPTQYSEEAIGFIVYNFNNIPETGLDLVATPYWVTADGTLVRGIASSHITSALIDNIKYQ